MSGLKAIIGADASGFEREMQAVDRMSQRVGARIKRNLENGGGGGGAHGGVNSGAMREGLVLIREITSGNWTRVPGSLSIFLERLGALKVVAGGVAGALGLVGAVVAGLGVGLYAAHKRTSALTEALMGLKLPEMTLEPIAKMHQGINHAAEAMRQLNEETAKASRNFNDVAHQSQFTMEASKSLFAHRKRMNEIENAHDPIKKAQRELELNKQERDAQLELMEIERQRLQAESRNRMTDAGNLGMVPSAQHDAEVMKQVKERADAAQKFINASQQPGFSHEAAASIFQGGLFQSGEAYEARAKTFNENLKYARALVQGAKDATNQQAENEAVRKKRDELEKEAAKSSARSAELAIEIGRQKTKNFADEQDEAEEAAARLSRVGMKHAGVNDLQRIGAYTAPAEAISLAKEANRRLKSIDDKLGKTGAARTLQTGVKF